MKSQESVSNFILDYDKKKLDGNLVSFLEEVSSKVMLNNSKDNSFLEALDSIVNQILSRDDVSDRILIRNIFYDKLYQHETKFQVYNEIVTGRSKQLWEEVISAQNSLYNYENIVETFCSTFPEIKEVEGFLFYLDSPGSFFDETVMKYIMTNKKIASQKKFTSFMEKMKRSKDNLVVNIYDGFIYDMEHNGIKF